MSQQDLEIILYKSPFTDLDSFLNPLTLISNNIRETTTITQLRAEINGYPVKNNSTKKNCTA